MKKMSRTVLLISLFTSLGFTKMPTQTIIYQAFTQKNTLNPNLIVAQRYDGNCSASSLIVLGRTDVWQCQASNMTLDPCFQDDTFMVCTVSPWAHKITLLQLNKLIKKSGNQINMQHRPWAVELMDGTKCTASSGTGTSINSIPITYTCNTYSFNIVGNLDRSSSNWKAHIYNYNKKLIEERDIKTAWF